MLACLQADLGDFEQAAATATQARALALARGQGELAGHLSSLITEFNARRAASGK